jgi:hypothetical protein
MPLKSAANAAERSALWFGDALVAGGAGGGGPALIHQPHHDSGLLGFVPQRLHQVGAAPPPKAEVVHPTCVVLGDAPGIADQQGAHALLDGEVDDLLGGLMLGLMDTATVARLGTPQPRPMTAPTARAALPGLGGAPAGRGLAGLLIRKMEVVLGAQRPPRHQHAGVLGHHRIRVDDPKIHACDPVLVQVVVLLDGDGGGDRQPQPSTIGKQGYRPDLLGWVRQGAGQPHPKVWLPSCD